MKLSKKITYNKAMKLIISGGVTVLADEIIKAGPYRTHAWQITVFGIASMPGFNVWKRIELNVDNDDTDADYYLVNNSSGAHDAAIQEGADLHIVFSRFIKKGRPMRCPASEPVDKKWVRAMYKDFTPEAKAKYKHFLKEGGV